VETIFGIVAAFIVQLLALAISYGALRQQVKDQGKQLDELKKKVQASNDLRAALVAPMAQVAERLKGVEDLLKGESGRLSDALRDISDICRDLTDRTSRMEGSLSKKKGN